MKLSDWLTSVHNYQGDIKAGRCALISGATGTVIALSQKRSI